MKNVYFQDFKAYFFLCNPSFPFLGLNLAPKFKKLQITDFAEKLSSKLPEILIPRLKNMYLDTKTNLIPLVKLVKS